MDSNFNEIGYNFFLATCYTDLSPKRMNEEFCRLLEAQRILAIPLLIGRKSNGFNLLFKTEADLKDFQKVVFPLSVGNPCPVSPDLN